MSRIEKTLITRIKLWLILFPLLVPFCPFVGLYNFWIGLYFFSFWRYCYYHKNLSQIAFNLFNCLEGQSEIIYISATLTFLKVVWILAWCGHIMMPLCEYIRSTSTKVTGTHHNLEKSGHRPWNCGRYKRLAVHLSQSLHVWSLPRTLPTGYLASW